jgi:hypothetical protein
MLEVKGHPTEAILSEGAWNGQQLNLVWGKLLRLSVPGNRGGNRGLCGNNSHDVGRGQKILREES